jgi:hypothetical protein
MEFLSHKEDVLRIELTPAGVDAMRRGEGTPAFYAFFDDDILYDPQYASGGTEAQRDVEGRILQNTPYLPSPRITTPVERNILREMENVPLENNVPLGAVQPIGQMAFGSDPTNIPRWNVQMGRGEMDSANSTIRVNGITELALQPTTMLWDFDGRLNPLTIPPELQQLFKDGSRVMVSPDFILLDIQELGVDFSPANFELELYEINEQGTEQQSIALWFKNRPSLVQDGLLLEPYEVQRYDEQVAASDDKLADFYFEILVDREIPDSVICDYNATAITNDRDNLYLQDQGVININTQGRSCPLGRVTTVNGQYVVRKEGDLGEPCL